MSKLDKQHKINLIASEDAKGTSQTVIAKQLNVAQSTVSRQLAKPEVKELSQRLRDALQSRHVHKFISRVVKEAKVANNVSDYMLGLSNDNPTRIETIEEAEKFLTRMDKTGLAIAKGVGILDTNTIRIGDDNSVSVTVSPAFQAYIAFQTSPQNGEYQEEIKEARVSDSVNLSS